MTKTIVIIIIGCVIFLLTCLASKNIKLGVAFGGLASVLAFVGPYIVGYFDGSKTNQETIALESEHNEEDYDTDVMYVQKEEIQSKETEEIDDTEIDSETEEDLTCITFIGETHNPSDVANQVNVADWIQDEDYDIAGKTYKGGVKTTIYNMFSAMDGNNSGILTEIVSESHFALDTNKIEKMSEGNQHFSGKFVIGKETEGSPSTAVVSILLDGEEVYNSGEIDCYSLSISPFDILLTGKTEMIIKIICQHKGNPFVIGLVGNE